MTSLPITIDDFTTGPYDVALAVAGSDDHYGIGGTILGGTRYTGFRNALDPRHTPATLDVGTADRLNVTVGVGQYVRLEVGYGWTPEGAEAPLGLNLAELGASAFRTNFEGVRGNFALNYNLVAFLEGGWSISGENLPSTGTPFSHDFPLASFTGPGGTDFGNLSYLFFVFQTLDDLAISSFEIV